MFRKLRKTPPHFKIPTPYAPMTAEHQKLRSDKPLCRFTLDSALTTSAEHVQATITHQYGEGMAHSYDDTIVVLNTETASDGVYTFSGAEGDAGLAFWNTSHQWVILYLLPKGMLIGGCLNEDHPGRGTVFELNLGTWDTADNKWVYASGSPVEAIDWRYDVPYPGEGATGLFEARESDTYGTIWETVSLDCSSPGTCGS